MTDEQIRIWEYYRNLADVVGTNNGAVKAYSVKHFFPEANDDYTPNAFVRAYLGDDVADDELPPLPVVNNFNELFDKAVCKKPSPNDAQLLLYDAQLEGIKNALTSRISLVQGPPGTGKTEMIVNLLSVIHHADPGATVAVLSPNNEALNNICEKIENDGELSPEIAELKGCFSRLGNKDNRKEWKEKLQSLERDARFICDKKENYNIRPAYLASRPIFTSTIHSLLKIFKNQGDNINEACFREYNMFDYIIIDECSQLSVLNGVAAMSRVRKSLVLVGDDEQLKPIINQNVEANIQDVYKEVEGKSFLGVCGKIFGDRTDAFAAKHVFLNEHYRCHPSIIGFCNTYVYGGKLGIKTEGNGEFRMRAKWYEGSYCEFRDINQNNNDNGNDNNNNNDNKKHREKVNNKQIEIFIREELPRIRNTEQSVVVLCPYRYELEELEKKLEKEAEAAAAAEVSGDEGTGVFTLTIHKSQGKGYDIVYLLTVDDYWQDEPWSQKKELINVAVSRAKQEFCIITSAVWLPEEMKPDDLKDVQPDGEKADSEESRFYCTLLKYIRDSTMNMSAEELGDYGFHKTKYESVFDKVPVYKELNKREQLENERLGLKKPDKYAPELCMEQVLKVIIDQLNLNRTADKKLKLYDHALIADIYSKSSQKADREAHEELFNYVYGNENNNYNAVSHFDFVICEESHDENDGGKEKVRLIIEVDGAFHRYDNFKDLDADKKRDEKKNTWVKYILQAGGIFLRFPTDGSRIIINDHAVDETEDRTILKALENTDPIDIWYEKGRHKRRKK